MRSLQRAADQRAQLAVLQLDTPGGLDTSMRQIIKAILGSPVPVATFIAPSGARAASAGHVYRLRQPYRGDGAGHQSRRGDADPDGHGRRAAARHGRRAWAAGGMPGVAGCRWRSRCSRGRSCRRWAECECQCGRFNPFIVILSAALPLDTQSTELRKQVHDAAAYIRGLAQMRGRNADWAERAVREAVSLSAQDALAQHVVDLIARDVPDLLRQVDGRTVATSSGNVTLQHGQRAARHRSKPTGAATSSRSSPIPTSR